VSTTGAALGSSTAAAIPRHGPAGRGAPMAGRRQAWVGRGFVAPAVAVLVLVGVFPFAWSVVVSFQNLAGANRAGDFVGFANYERLLADARLWAAVGRTFAIMAVALPVQLLLGLLMAWHFQADRPGKRLFVALLVLPSVISPMVAGSMWRLMLDQKFGPVNQVISWLAGERVVLLWTVKPDLAFWAIVIAEIWQWTPFMFVILLSALANVDRDLVDAAALDGANRVQAFFRVVLPTIRPVIVIALVIRGLDLFRLFDIVWQLTRGGPGNKSETVSIFMYIKGFQGFETSYVAALVVVLAVLLTAVVMTALRRLEVAR
jgi:multiple sugar transport system permease protein